jgi:hypothetical protein
MQTVPLSLVDHTDKVRFNSGEGMMKIL